jgi:microsomal dipeptidase-like Zn-dependent dipeptidase
MQHALVSKRIAIGLVSLMALLLPGGLRAEPVVAKAPVRIAPATALPAGATLKTPIRVEPLPAPPPPPLLGFVDLHAHPATHLAWGAVSSGSGKLVAGAPGMAVSRDTLAADLRACSAEHFWDDADVVRSMTRTQIRDAMDAGMPHGRSGWSTLSDWPQARSVLHQQMHITWVQRAYQGGLRLMVASIVDNQTLAMLWNRHQFAPAPRFDANSDFESAQRQIAFIERWVDANAGWMQIVTSPTEAREAIRNNKLAIVLGTEMDTLSTDQILTLARRHRVRLVLPIHFANNQFGGPAVYGDLFNTNNKFVTGSFYQVRTDPDLAFRLGEARYLRYVDHTEVDSFETFLAGLLTAGSIGAGAMKPTVDASVVYPTTGGGHRNSKAFEPNAMKALLREGLIIDVAHMSQLAHQGMLALTAPIDYPVLNSHTGLRNGPAESERAMRTTDATQMASEGGVLGIGTVGDNQTAHIADEVPPRGGNVVARLTGAGREWLRTKRAASDHGFSYRFVRVTVVTGGDDKRDNEAALAVITTRGGARQEFDLVPERRGLGGGSTLVKTFPLSPPLALRDIDRVGVRHDTGKYFKDGLWRDEDNWDVKVLQVELLPDPVTAWASEASAALTTLRGSGGIALGTDMNGLEKQMPGLPTISVSYPINIVQRYAPGMRLADGSTPPALHQHVTGSRTFDLRTDGLAHYGMLPDFLQAVSTARGGDRVVRELFNGAERVIQLWEKAEAAKGRVP